MKIAMIAAAVILFITTSAMAQQKYPPYPDVWGRELPVSGRGKPGVETAIYPAADGDMLAYESFLVGEGQAAKMTVRRVSFFSGQDVSVSNKELKQQGEKWPGPIPRSQGVRLDFPDGLKIRAGGFDSKLQGLWYGCLDFSVVYSHRNYIHEADKILVRIYPSEIDVKEIKAGCDPERQPTIYRTRVRFSFLSSNQDYILPDGTFLTVMDDDFLVRFDRKLNSPFIDSRPDLFILDFSQVEPILAEATRRETEEPGFNPLQFIHDRLTELVTAMPKPIPH